LTRLAQSRAVAAEEAPFMPHQLKLDLGDDPFLRMAALFDGKYAPPGRLTMSALDGLIAAISIGPALVPPSEWIAAAWGDEAPIFDSQEDAQTIFEALTDFYNDVVRSIDEDAYEPLFACDEDGAPVIDDWCYGFVAGVALRADEWAPFFGADESVYVLPIMAHVPEFNQGRVDPAELAQDFDPDVAIPALVQRIRAYWSAERAKRPTGTLFSGVELRVKVGRNQPCPCGSGRKFKHCCLNAERRA
jgi:uncharacterized protein